MTHIKSAHVLNQAICLFVCLLCSCQPIVVPASLLVEPTLQYQVSTTPTLLELSSRGGYIAQSTPTVQVISTKAALSPTSLPSNLVYYAQSGDTLDVVALRFDVNVRDISSPDFLPRKGLLVPGQVLHLPLSPSGSPPSPKLLPDSEIIFSPSAVDFDVAAYLKEANGFLANHREYLKSTGWTQASEIIERIARENSINPRILLSLLEYKCGCVLGQPGESVDVDYLLGNTDFRRKGLYRQIGWAASRLSVGYYGWRNGSLLSLPLSNGIMYRPPPDFNAGSVAIANFFAYFENFQAWKQATHTRNGFPALHANMFADPWERAKLVEPLFPPGLSQPALILPFEPGRLWAYTSGPHTVWENEGAQAALDFAPATHESGCTPTKAWAVAMADGLVVRTEFGAVIQDLDGADGSRRDGIEQTGWALLYMHIASQDRVPVGTYLRAGERIGHPSCEGGRTTGTHIHIARKYNGEWIAADGPLSFNLEGWVAHAGPSPYEGTLTKQGLFVIAKPYGSFLTHIIRPTVTPIPVNNESQP